MNLHELIAHLHARAPGFTARMNAANLTPDDIREPGDLHALPVLRKDELIALQAEDPPFGGMLACAPGELKRLYQSPGPINEPEPRVADYWRWQGALRAAGFAPGDVVINAFGYHLTPAGAMFDEGLAAVGCAVIPAGVGSQEPQVRIMHALGVTGYVGLPSYLKNLLEKADELGVEVSLTRAFVAAEPLPPSLRAWFDNRGIAVYQGYGTAECGNLGYECDQRDGWHVPDGAIVEVCDINTGRPVPAGETGEVIATLFLPDYAMIRFGTGDLSTLNTDPCPCGRSSHRLVGWQGRVGDAVKVRGMFLHPRQLAGVMARFSDITRHQAVITREEHRDQLAVRVALASGADADAVIEQLEPVIRDVLKFRASIEVVGDDALARDSPALVDERVWD